MPEKGKPRALLAAGGTGGHMFPAQALSEELGRMGWQCAMITDARGRKHAGRIQADPIIEVKAASISPRRPVQALRGSLQLAQGVRQAKAFMRDWQPDVVVGFGGYPSFPALRAAEGLNIPRVIHEQNAVLGRVNRVFARKATVVASGFEDLAKLPVGANHVVVGNPLRDSLLNAARSLSFSLEGEGARRADEGVRQMVTPSTLQPSNTLTRPSGAPSPLRERDIELLIVGGSLGANILSDVIPPAIAALPDDLRRQVNVTQQVTESRRTAATDTYAAADIPATLDAFFSDIHDHLANADLIIARAGASSVAEIALMGLPSILVPLGIAMDDHQTANAKALERLGAAVILPESGFTPDALTELLTELLRDPERLDQMGRSAQSLARPDAARDLAALVVQAAQ